MEVAWQEAQHSLKPNEIAGGENTRERGLQGPQRRKQEGGEKRQQGDRPKWRGVGGVLPPGGVISYPDLI